MLEKVLILQRQLIGKLSDTFATSPMKLLTPLLLLGLIGCNSSSYPSQRQAKEACERWKWKGETISYTYIVWGTDEIETTKTVNRYCDIESQTNQYLGYQGVFDEAAQAKENANVGSFMNSPWAANHRIVRHFRY